MPRLYTITLLSLRVHSFFFFSARICYLSGVYVTKNSRITLKDSFRQLPPFFSLNKILCLIFRKWFFLPDSFHSGRISFTLQLYSAILCYWIFFSLSFFGYYYIKFFFCIYTKPPRIILKWLLTEWKCFFCAFVWLQAVDEIKATAAEEIEKWNFFWGIIFIAEKDRRSAVRKKLRSSSIVSKLQLDVIFNCSREYFTS